MKKFQPLLSDEQITEIHALTGLLGVSRYKRFARAIEKTAVELDRHGRGESAMAGDVEHIHDQLSRFRNAIRQDAKDGGVENFNRTRDIEQELRAAIDRIARKRVQPANGEDARRLDWLESQINERGAIHLHDGRKPYGHGLGLCPGTMKRSLRDAIDKAMQQEGQS
jgi:hypothetical protein